MLTASAPVQVKKRAKPALSPAQKTFQKLKKKVECLQQDSKEFQKELEECLLYYHNQIVPVKKSLIDEMKKLVVLLYGHYQNKKLLSKEQRHFLKELLLDKINKIFQSTTYNNADPEITAIFKELGGRSYDEIIDHELDDLKKEMQGMFREEGGIDIDLSSIDKTDNEEEILRKLFEAMAKANMDEKEEEICKPKSKKQIQKEEKEKELNTLQKREIGAVYKQLVKAFHPDLVQDPEEKLEKEKLMKQLTSAYENNDLHTLLLLEMEWMSQTSDKEKVKSEDQLKIYNSLLKDQIASIEEGMEMSILNPRYVHIQPYLSGTIFSPLQTLNLVYFDFLENVNKCKQTVKDLQGKGAAKIVQAILQHAIDESEEIIF